jgi:hypothetical protein
MRTGTVSFSKDIPLNTDYDVIVASGGPAGCAAAAAAARSGAKTLLLEASHCLGGMGTIGLVSNWCPFSDQEKLLYCGIAEEVLTNTKAHMRHIDPNALDWVAIDPEAFKRVYDSLVTNSGTDVLFGSMVSGVSVLGDRIEYLAVSGKQGFTAWQASCYVDATGDADIATYAGLPFDIGGDDSGSGRAGEGVHELHPASLCFSITNVDEYMYRTGPRTHSSLTDCPVYDVVNDPQYPDVVDGHSCNALIGPCAVAFNAGHIWDVDPTDPLSVSRAMVKGRRLADQFQRGLARYYPSAFGAGFLAATASAMGVLESRRIRGDYTLILEDCLARRAFEDEIGRNCYYIDVHHTAKQVEDWNTDRHNDQTFARHYQPGESHGIPYRCLIPQGLDNLLVADKTISCDRDVQGSARVMPPCLVTGQAAGTAAAMATQAGTGTRGVDAQALRAQLRRDGAYFL